MYSNITTVGGSGVSCIILVVVTQKTVKVFCLLIE